MKRVLLIWGVVVAAALTALHLQGYTVLSLVIATVAFVKTNPLGPLLLIGAYLLRPLILAPCSLLAASCGYCYGALGGFAVAMAGCFLAAILGFGLGRRTGLEDSRLGNWAERLKRSGLRYTMYMRWMMLPYDPVSLVCGASGVPLLAFLLGTVIGNTPGTLSCVLFGAGIQGEFNGQLPSFDWRFHGPALALMIVSLTLSKFLSARQS